MRTLRINNAREIIRACLTEDKDYCLTNSSSSLLWAAIDECVNVEVAKILSDVIPYRIERDNGDLVGYTLVRLHPKREVVSTFIRPIMRENVVEADQVVNELKKTAIKPVR